MKRVGEILKQERLKRKLTLEQAAQATRIRPPVLEALENSRYAELPGTVFARGLVKNYAEFLGLDQGKTLAFFRREYGSAQEGEKVLPAPAPGRVGLLQFDSTRAVLALVGLVFLFTSLFFVWQYRRFAREPQAILTYPPDGAVLLQPNLKVTGRTDVQNQVTINGQKVLVDSSGFFSQNLFFEPGWQIIEALIINPQGRQKVIKRAVQVQAPTEENFRD